MNPCDECPIDDKIYECCGRFPETGEMALLQVNHDRSLYACPHLTASGKCGIYEKRPYACQTHHCHHYNAMNAIDGEYLPLKNHWNVWCGNND